MLGDLIFIRSNTSKRTLVNLLGQSLIYRPEETEDRFTHVAIANGMLQVVHAIPKKHVCVDLVHSIYANGGKIRVFRSEELVTDAIVEYLGSGDSEFDQWAAMQLVSFHLTKNIRKTYSVGGLVFNKFSEKTYCSKFVADCLREAFLYKEYLKSNITPTELFDVVRNSDRWGDVSLEYERLLSPDRLSMHHLANSPNPHNVRGAYFSILQDLDNNGDVREDQLTLERPYLDACIDYTHQLYIDSYNYVKNTVNRETLGWDFLVGMERSRKSNPEIIMSNLDCDYGKRLIRYWKSRFDAFTADKIVIAPEFFILDYVNGKPLFHSKEYLMERFYQSNE